MAYEPVADQTIWELNLDTMQADMTDGTKAPIDLMLDSAGEPTNDPNDAVVVIVECPTSYVVCEILAPDDMVRH